MIKTSDLLWQDVQHQELFKIIDEIKDAITPDLIKRLQGYIAHHFYLEEQYMKEYSYPYAKQHIEAHKTFAKKVNALISDNPGLTPEVGENFAVFLNEWLTEHVLGIDKDFESYLIELNKTIII